MKRNVNLFSPSLVFVLVISVIFFVEFKKNDNYKALLITLRSLHTHTHTHTHTNKSFPLPQSFMLAAASEQLALACSAFRFNSVALLS
jgi:hypothetical protein